MVIHGEATSARALGEQNSLFSIRVKGELKRDGSCEVPSNVMSWMWIEHCCH
jgi:hypothetical protein